MKIRLAEKCDCLDLLRWRNNYKTILNTVSQSAITYFEHCKWFNKVIRSTTSDIFIGYDQKERMKFGMIRFDKKGKNLIEVSINMCPRFRRKRLGEKFLNQTIKLASSFCPKSILIARVMVGNNASRKLFKKCGFHITSIKNKTVHFSYKIH